MNLFFGPSRDSPAVVKAAHITDLRTALDQARAAIGLSALAYTDPAIVVGVTTVKTAHITNLRDGVK